MISGKVYDVNKQTIHIVLKSTTESRASTLWANKHTGLSTLPELLQQSVTTETQLLK